MAAHSALFVCNYGRPGSEKELDKFLRVSAIC